MEDPTSAELTTTTTTTTTTTNGADDYDDTNGEDTEGMAFAAEAAAEAVEAADAATEQQRLDQSFLVCRICGGGSEEGRPILRFLPVDHDAASAAAAPGVTTFTQDIALHVFCGKTASILPNVNQPELEILTKAGLKNKHGIGPEVNAALARTRCAILQQDGAKEKHFYLVREFEAHLAAIRHTHISFINDIVPPSNGVPLVGPGGGGGSSNSSNSIPQPDFFVPAPPPGSTADLPSFGDPSQLIGADPSLDIGNNNTNNHHLLNNNMLIQQQQQQHQQNAQLLLDPYQQQQQQYHQHYPQHQLHHFHQPQQNSHLPPFDQQHKTVPVRAAAGQVHKPGRRTSGVSQEDPLLQQQGGAVVLTEEGKVRCSCGGTHWPLGTPRGNASWKSHMSTKRHQKWMEENGLVGTV